MELVLATPSFSEHPFFYASKCIEVDRRAGLIGYLRQDFHGNQWYSSFFDFDAKQKTPEFKAELDSIINALRFDDAKKYDCLLGSMEEMKACFAEFNPEKPEGMLTGEESNV